MNYNGNEYFYNLNLQGDIIGLMDINGNTIVRYYYDAWGNSILQEDTSGIRLADINPFRYRGYYYDSEINLYHCNSRYYNPKYGKWLSVDDINYMDPSSANGLNLYVYCGNNPVMTLLRAEEILTIYRELL